MRPQLVILGNAGAARECYWLARECMDNGLDIDFKGFLAFEGHQGDLRDLAGHFLGSDDDYSLATEDVFVIGIGLPALRRKAFCKWKNRGAQFINLVHPNVHQIGHVTLGEGNILACGTYISCNAVIGDANFLNGSVVVGHDVRIGNFNFFGPFSLLLGGACVGAENSFGVHTVLLAHASIGNHNVIAPGAYVYKGCGNEQILAGNPALSMGHVDKEHV